MGQFSTSCKFESSSRDMQRPSDYKSDLQYSVHTSRKILRMIGAWPLSKHSSISEKILTKYLNIFCYFLLLATLVPGLLRLFLKEKNPRIRLKMIGPLFNCMMCIIKYSFLLLRAGAIKKCVEAMGNDWKEVVQSNDRPVLILGAKIAHQLTMLSVIFMYGGGLSYRIIVPLSRGAIVTPQNVTVRPLACPGYFFKLNEQATPAYEVIFMIQFVAGLVSYSVACGLCGLAAMFVMHTCGQLKVLIGRMVALSEGTYSSDESVSRQLAAIVRHHIRIQLFLKEVEAILQHPCLVEIVGCTCLICLVGYSCILEWESSDATAAFTYFVLVVSFVFSIFLFCYIGQLLTNQGNEVAVAASTINWYRLPPAKARSMILIIAMSHCPAKLSAGKMMEMSLTSFGNIIKAAIGYFNILRKTLV